MNISVGMLLADLHVTYAKSATTLLPPVVPILLIAVGTLLSCYPQDAPENTVWSDTMRVTMFTITPSGADIRRYWDSIGATLITLGVFFSPHARRILSSSICNFLGRVSFPVYLLHNQLIKTLLTWMVYLPSVMDPTLDNKGEIVLWYTKGRDLWVFASVVIYLWVLYRLAVWWTVYIDPAVARVVRWGVRLAYGEGDGLGSGEKPLIPV